RAAPLAPYTALFRSVVLRCALSGRRHAAEVALVYRAVRLLRVRLEAHPHARGVLLAAGRRAQVAVGVAARRAVVLRRAETGRRHAAQVALVYRTVRLLRVRLEAHPHARGVLLAARRRAQVAVGVA